jgi:hypothetical protein
LLKIVVYQAFDIIKKKTNEDPLSQFLKKQYAMQVQLLKLKLEELVVRLTKCQLKLVDLEQQIYL